MDAVAQAYHRLTGIHAPNPMQRSVWTRVRDGEWGVGLLLKAPTGSGKTEAVAVPALDKGDRRLIMVYPTRSLVEDQVERFKRMLAHQSLHSGGKLVTLVVDTGAQSHRFGWRDGKEARVGNNPRRHLYQGDVIITTLDKLLYRFFGFGEPNKSYVFPLRIHYGSLKTLICFDEAHAYNDVAFANFNRLIKTLYTKGVDVALMTATMPEAFAAEFDYLDQEDFIEDEGKRASLDQFTRKHYPKRCHPARRLVYVPASVEAAEEDERSPAIEQIISLGRSHRVSDQRLIVTVERVKDAVAVFRALWSDEFDGELVLYHGRLTAERRRWVYAQLIELERQNKGYVLVSTSAIEVGCDLNAHCLITQLCEPDKLIQRAGRCNRRQEMPDAKVIVVGSTIPHWLTDMKPEDLERLVATLENQNEKSMDIAALMSCLVKRPNPDDRVEMLFDMLYEYVYEAHLENKRLHDIGLVVTRSWEPSLTLCTGYDAHDRPVNAVEVPMRRCIAKKDEPLTPFCWIFKDTFDWQERKPVRSDLGRWECAYSSDVIVELQDYPFDDIVGYEELPKVFSKSYPAGYRRILERVNEDGTTSKLWYIDPERGNAASLMDQTVSISEDEGDEEDNNEE